MASRLGGRNEVMDMPLIEALGYLLVIFDEEERAAEEKVQAYYAEHISRLKSRQPQNDEQAKDQERFLEEIRPQPKRKNIEAAETQSLEWDFEAMKAFKA